jgi:hypothetical protein
MRDPQWLFGRISSDFTSILKLRRVIRWFKSFKDEVDHADVNHRLTRFGKSLIVLAVNPAAAEPSKGPLHHPTLG